MWEGLVYFSPTFYKMSREPSRYMRYDDPAPSWQSPQSCLHQNIRSPQPPALQASGMRPSSDAPSSSGQILDVLLQRCWASWETGHKNSTQEHRCIYASERLLLPGLTAPAVCRGWIEAWCCVCVSCWYCWRVQRVQGVKSQVGGAGELRMVLYVLCGEGQNVS